MKKIMLVAALATFSLSVFAQGGEKGPFVTNKLFDNTFVSAGVGVNIYVGESDLKSLKPAFALDVAFGKWFTPSVGARVGYAGLQAKGNVGDPNGRYVNGKVDKFGVGILHADFLWNFSSSFGGYKPSRFYEVVGFAGFGPAMSYGTQAATKKKTKDIEWAFTAGLVNKFRLSDVIDANVELRGLVVPENFDGTVGGSRLEGMAAITAGISYKFGKRDFDKHVAVAPADYTPYINKINAIESDLAASEARAAQLAKDLEAAKSQKPTVITRTTVKTESEFLLPQTLIFFEVGKTVLSEKEKVNLGYLASAIKRLPAGTVVKVIGNADYTTGSKAFNERLSKQRAQAVYDALIKAGVEASKLEVSSTTSAKDLNSGSPALNRAVFVTE